MPDRAVNPYAAMLFLDVGLISVALFMNICSDNASLLWTSGALRLLTAFCSLDLNKTLFQDIIYYGCYVHTHIGMNKLFRKIMFTDMAIRGMPERNITGLAVCAQKKWDVIFQAWHSVSKKSGT